VAAALAALSDAGITQSRMGRLAGVNRSQVNRWSRGENRPGYDPVRRLAAALFPQFPVLAEELVEASGYAWAEPGDAPARTIPPKVLTAIEESYDPEKQARIIEMLEEINARAERVAAREASAEEPPESSGASSTHAG
jgi:transcriptional regulator with XRE-family HTH domain